MARLLSSPSDDTYVELVERLFATGLPATIMVAAFTAVGVLLADETGDRPLIALTILGIAAGVARLAVLFGYRPQVRRDTLTAVEARRIERVFALPYILFAVVLGLFAARAFVVASPEAHILVAELLVAYGAGVATGITLRPWIAFPSILAATLPSIITALTLHDMVYRLAGLLLGLFLVGALDTMASRYRSAVQNIGMRRLFCSMARHDPLTGLANRLLLQERFDVSRNSATATMLAVHCLDLDRFKPVNDRYGHPIGDQLLKAVAGRLEGALRRGDLAVRTGGDEFTILQPDIRNEDEANMLARRLARALSQPYAFDGIEIEIGISIGFAVSDARAAELDTLVRAADRALYHVKQRGGGVASTHDIPQAPLRLVG